MYDFSNVSDNDLAETWKLIRLYDSRPLTGIRRAVAVELTARIHGIVPELTWVVAL